MTANIQKLQKRAQFLVDNEIRLGLNSKVIALVEPVALQKELKESKAYNSVRLAAMDLSTSPATAQEDSLELSADTSDEDNAYTRMIWEDGTLIEHIDNPIVFQSFQRYRSIEQEAAEKKLAGNAQASAIIKFYEEVIYSERAQEERLRLLQQYLKDNPALSATVCQHVGPFYKILGMLDPTEELSQSVLSALLQNKTIFMNFANSQVVADACVPYEKRVVESKEQGQAVSQMRRILNYSQTGRSFAQYVYHHTDQLPNTKSGRHMLVRLLLQQPDPVLRPKPKTHLINLFANVLQSIAFAVIGIVRVDRLDQAVQKSAEMTGQDQLKREAHRFKQEQQSEQYELLQQQVEQLQAANQALQSRVNGLTAEYVAVQLRVALTSSSSPRKKTQPPLKLVKPASAKVPLPNTQNQHSAELKKLQGQMGQLERDNLLLRQHVKQLTQEAKQLFAEGVGPDPFDDALRVTKLEREFSNWPSPLEGTVTANVTASEAHLLALTPRSSSTLQSQSALGITTLPGVSTDTTGLGITPDNSSSNLSITRTLPPVSSSGALSTTRIGYSDEKLAVTVCEVGTEQQLDVTPMFQAEDDDDNDLGITARLSQSRYGLLSSPRRDAALGESVSSSNESLNLTIGAAA